MASRSPATLCSYSLSYSFSTSLFRLAYVEKFRESVHVNCTPRPTVVLRLRAPAECSEIDETWGRKFQPFEAKTIKFNSLDQTSIPGSQVLVRRSCLALSLPSSDVSYSYCIAWSLKLIHQSLPFRLTSGSYGIAPKVRFSPNPVFPSSPNSQTLELRCLRSNQKSRPPLYSLWMLAIPRSSRSPPVHTHNRYTPAIT